MIKQRNNMCVDIKNVRVGQKNEDLIVVEVDDEENLSVSLPDKNDHEESSQHKECLKAEHDESICIWKHNLCMRECH